MKNIQSALQLLFVKGQNLTFSGLRISISFFRGSFFFPDLMSIFFVILLFCLQLDSSIGVSISSSFIYFTVGLDDRGIELIVPYIFIH